VNLVTLLIGLIVGALASGIAQSVLARLDRNRDARAAARLLYMKLHSADAARRALQINKAWVPANLDLAQYMVAWEQRSDALSHVLKSKAAIDVDAAFSLMDTVAMKKAEDEAAAKKANEPLGFSFPMDVLAIYRREVEAAKLIVHHAAFTKIEHWRRKVPEPSILPPPDFVPPKGG
jgi:hypothetical protein